MLRIFFEGAVCMFKRFLVFFVVVLESLSFIHFSYLGNKCLAYKKEKTASEKLVTSNEKNGKQPGNSVVILESNINVNEGKNKIEVQRASRVSLDLAEPFIQKKKISVSTASKEEKIGVKDTTVVAAGKDNLETKEANDVSIFRKTLNKLGKWVRKYRFFAWVPNSIRAAIGEMDLTLAAVNILFIIFKGRDILSFLEDFEVAPKIRTDDVPKKI